MLPLHGICEAGVIVICCYLKEDGDGESIFAVRTTREHDPTVATEAVPPRKTNKGRTYCKVQSGTN